MAHAGPKFAHKAIPEADKVVRPGLIEPQVVKQVPRRYRKARQPPAADSAEPADQERRIAPRNSVCHQEVDVFLKKDIGKGRIYPPASRFRD